MDAILLKATEDVLNEIGKIKAAMVIDNDVKSRKQWFEVHRIANNLLQIAHELDGKVEKEYTDRLLVQANNLGISVLRTFMD